MNYQVGTIVKAYDFPNSDEHFLVGVIKEVREFTIVCDTVRRVWDGELRSVEDGETFETPKLGQAWNDRRSDRPRLAELDPKLNGSLLALS